MLKEFFIEEAKSKIYRALLEFEDTMLSLVEQAWDEGKRNADTENVMEIVREAIRRVGQMEPEKPDHRPVERLASDAPDVCTSFHRVSTGPDSHVDQCWGVPEAPECSCGGDMTKCKYYRFVREEAGNDA